MSSSKDNNMTPFINFPILIYDHIHPLLFCNCLRGRNFDKGWECDKCSSNYSVDTPSFYYTVCDYDLCQSCLGEYKLKKIKRYYSNYNYDNITKNIYEILPWQINYPNHKHFLSLVKKMNECYCDNCKKKYNGSNSYYCSLCDYDLFKKCSNNTINIRNTESSIDKEEESNTNDHSTSDYSSRVYNNGCSNYLIDDRYWPFKPR